MRIIERENIDVHKWNSLVDCTANASFFSYAWYLDATAENWCVLVDDAYSKGIALPYSVRLGVETLYTPIFVRYSELLGDTKITPEEIEIISHRFDNARFTTNQEVFHFDATECVYQRVNKDSERKIGSQAKRMLKKAERCALNVIQSKDPSNVLRSIESELSGKFKGIDEKSLNALGKLFDKARSVGVLKVFEIERGGGIVCLEKEDALLYLKGAVADEDKKNGAMYLCLNEAIEYAISKSKNFDFGGSRIKGVQQFNYNLGGVDQIYFEYIVDNEPNWYKLARRFKKTWSKK